MLCFGQINRSTVCSTAFDPSVLCFGRLDQNRLCLDRLDVSKKSNRIVRPTRVMLSFGPIRPKEKSNGLCISQTCRNDQRKNVYVCISTDSSKAKKVIDCVQPKRAALPSTPPKEIVLDCDRPKVCFVSTDLAQTGYVLTKYFSRIYNLSISKTEQPWYFSSLTCKIG